MVVIGVAVAAERWLSGCTREAFLVLGIFLAIPVGIAVMTSIDIPWLWVIALVLIGVGVTAVVKAVSPGPPG